MSGSIPGRVTAVTAENLGRRFVSSERGGEEERTGSRELHDFSPCIQLDSTAQLTVLVHTEPLAFWRSFSYGVWPPRDPCGRLKL
jgi:hypothetical protein